MHTLRLPLQIPIMTPYAVGLVNGWLFLGDEPALIDVGPNTEQGWHDLLAGLSTHGITPADLRHILITHAHVDHYGNGQRLAHAAPHAIIYAPDIAHARPMLLDLDEEWQRQGDFMAGALRISGLPDTIAQKGYDYFNAMREEGSAVPVTQWLYGGEQLALGDGVWEVVRLPGHSTTQIGLWQKETDWFIGADHLLPRISSNALLEPPAPGETRRPRALPQYIESLKWMATLPPQQVFPGHGDPFFDQGPLIAKRLEAIDQRADQLYQALRTQPRTVYELVNFLFPQLKESQLFLAVSEIAGHLDVLESRNLIAYEGKAVRTYYAPDSHTPKEVNRMKTLEEPFYHTLLAAPTRAYDVIVTTDGETQAVAELCEALGITVHRRFRIIPGLSATGKGGAVLDLAKHPHVKRIEPDGQVHAI
jgi:glyoxylase-like metal-dependent hydrolase (beta-lactamase superfamily II)